MQNFISSSDLLCWNIILKGNSAKSMTIDNDGNLKIHPPITAEEHQQVQREEKAKTILLSSLPDEHMGDFYHMIDARDIWNAIKARFDKGYDKMQKILTQMNTLKIKPDPEDVNMKFLRGLPPSWSGIALILKTKGGLKYISFDDLYKKLKFLEIDTKGYLSSSSTLSNADFVSTDGLSQGNLSYQESGNGGYTTTHSVSLGSSSSKGYSKSKCSVVDDVIYSFFANHEIDQHLVYEDLDQMNKEDFKEYDLKHQMAMRSIKVHRFKKKHGRKIKFNGRENARFDKKLVKCFNCKQMGHFSRECRAQGGQNSNNYKKYKSKEAGKDGSDSKAMVVVDDADSEGEVVSADDAIPAGVSVSAGDVAVDVVSPHSGTEFALKGLSTEAKWNNNGKNLYKLINSSMSVRTKRGLGLDKYIREGELGIDDFKFSIFHTNIDELEGQPIYNRFASVDHMKAVPPPLTGNYMPPSNIPDIDESQMVYGKKATNSSEIKTNDDSIFHSYDSVLFDFCDRSSKPSTNDFQTYLHLIKDCDLHEQRLVKRNAEGKGKLGRRPTGKPVNLNRPKPVSACQPNPVFAGKATLACNSIPLSVSAAGSESHPPMLNKENYVPWSSRLLRYAKSRPNGKLVHKSILNGPYVRKIIPEPGDANREITVIETFHLQTDDELSEKELKQIKADDQAIQTIFLDLPEDIYEKKAKLFNEWEMFTSNEGESIESYYHRFLKLMNDLKRNKHFPEKIASNLKFLNNLQPKWSRHVTIVHQTKDLHTADYTQLYDFLKYNQKEVDELKAERLAKNQDPLALMANSNNPVCFSSTSSRSTIVQSELLATTNAKS
nr:hypothetical protein [Tanacetum cinerariifolium]